MKYLLTCIACLGMVLPAFSQYRQLGKEGNAAYKNGNYTAADSLYAKSLAQNPEFSEAQFNRGNALYKAGKYPEAAEQYLKIAKNSKDNEMKSRAWHNLGNTYLKQKNIENSIKSYKEALRLDPKNDDARYNLAYAQRMLPKQQPPSQQGDKQQKNQQGDKDQQQQGSGDQDTAQDNQQDQQGEKNSTSNKSDQWKKMGGDKPQDQTADNQQGDKKDKSDQQGEKQGQQKGEQQGDTQNSDPQNGDQPGDKKEGTGDTAENKPGTSEKQDKGNGKMSAEDIQKMLEEVQQQQQEQSAQNAAQTNQDNKEEKQENTPGEDKAQQAAMAQEKKDEAGEKKEGDQAMAIQGEDQDTENNSNSESRAAYGNSTRDNYSNTDARRILQSLSKNEQQVQEKVKAKTSKGSKTKTTKDW